MDKSEISDVQLKLSRLTVPGAREFWDEIEEWLDAIITKCTKDYDRVKTIDEMKEKQILKKLCQRMKDLPDYMVTTLRLQLAEPSPSDKIDEDKILNFIADNPVGVKTQEE